MTTDERIAAIQTALAAVEHARELCNAAGIGGIAVVGQLTITQTFDDIVKGLDAAVESVRRQAPDIKGGDPVTVQSRWHKASSAMYALEKVGRVWVRVGGLDFDRDSGCDRAPSNYSIHPDDLARINRCFPRKAGAK